MTTKEKKEQMRCGVKGKVKKNAVLRAGMISGDLTPHPGIKRIKPCVKKCCQDMKCEVAVMLENKCYTMRCINKEYCQSRPAPPSAYSKNPMLAFVKRENLYKGKGWVTSLWILLSFFFCDHNHVILLLLRSLSRWLFEDWLHKLYPSCLIPHLRSVS